MFAKSRACTAIFATNSSSCLPLGAAVLAVVQLSLSFSRHASSRTLSFEPRRRKSLKKHVLFDDVRLSEDQTAPQLHKFRQEKTPIPRARDVSLSPKESRSQEKKRPVRSLAQRIIANSRARELEWVDAVNNPKVRSGGTKREGTMTGPERRAFARLIRSTTSGSQEGENKKEPSTLATEADSSERLYTNRSFFSGLDQDLQEESEDMEEFAEAYGEAPDTMLCGGVRMKSQALQRHPEVLQAMRTRMEQEMAHERASSGQAQAAPCLEPQSKQTIVTVQQARQKFSKIREKLLGAETDHEIWNVLDAEAFYPIKALDLDSGLSSSSSGGILAIQAEQVERAGPSPATSTLQRIGMKSQEGGVASTRRPCLRVLAQIYSPTVTLATRLLTRRAAFTPLAFAVLCTVKELGRSSHLLGASTSLYNELINFTWQTNGELQQIVALLNEMEEAGLAMNARTASILDKVAARATEDMQAHRSAAKDDENNYDAALQRGAQLTREMRYKSNDSAAAMPASASAASPPYTAGRARSDKAAGEHSGPLAQEQRVEQHLEPGEKSMGQAHEAQERLNEKKEEEEDDDGGDDGTRRECDHGSYNAATDDDDDNEYHRRRPSEIRQIKAWATRIHQTLAEPISSC